MLDGDHKSLFLAWLDENSASVIKVARAYTLTKEESQDLAQEILLQAWRSVPNFEGQSSPATWFYRVALHTAMNWHKKDQPRRANQQSLLDVQILASNKDNSTEISDQQEIVDRLYEAIHQLKQTDAALVLLYLDEMSYREISAVLGISESNVGVKLNRVKNRLRDLMKGDSDGS